MRRAWLLLLTLLTAGTRVHGYLAPVVANATYCDFDVIRAAETAGDSSYSTTTSDSSNNSAWSAGKSLLDSLPEAQRPYRDGPLLLGGRTIQWYTPHQACQLLSGPATTVMFVGDSLTRHFMQGLQMLVRADVEHGAMQEHAPDNITQACTCDLQFKLKACRQWLLRDTHNVTSTAQLPCPEARVVYVETSTDEHAAAQYHRISELAAQQPRSVILLGGWGLHNRLLAKPVFNNLIHRTWKLVHHHAHITVLCLGIHALQNNVPEQYKDTFNNKKVTEYNALLRRLCKAHDIPFFDTFAVTLNQTSFDGSHYELRVNVLKAQLLLNVLADMGWGRTTSGR